MEVTVSTPTAVRALAPTDLDTVVAIDAAIEGRSRRAYIERRLAAALRDPALHAQFAVSDGEGMAGHMLARLIEDEFGRGDRGLRLELLGLRPAARGQGLGRQLFEALLSWALRHGVTELRTAADWNNAALLRWLDAMGFSLAPAYVVDCAVDAGAYRPERDDAIGLPDGEGPGHERRFDDAGPGNDFERLARDRADVRSMSAADIDDIVRIDRGITGRDRGAYLRAKLAEAVDEAGVRVSLTARRDGVNVGYLMARVDLGDFGRTAPVAIIDTLGVDPRYARQGVGRALLSQLFTNLGALRVERVETVVSARELGLLGFLFSVGFAPAQRLPFVRRVG